MPPKVNVHLSEQRAWGTRYDSFNASPSPRSSSVSPSVVDSESPEFSVTTGRSWADDEVVINTGVLEAEDTHSNASSQAGESARMPHDASVFIGSLPANIKETELVHLLTEHLSHFADIQNIKFIHDGKGGICAFVQCENASQAARIISQNRSSPRAFMGRYLRYEAARAFRSLLISYRKPTQFVLYDNNEGSAPRVEGRENHLPGRVVELELPSAMRIWRPPAARYPVVLYESEARNFDDSHTESGFFIDHLRFDVEDIRKMASAFGPLESLIEYGRFSNRINKEEKGDNSGLQAIDDIRTPTPHNAPRSDVMDNGIWEVKWCHRDDCLSALMTLRRVPHLNVTWAHQRGVSPSVASTRNSLVRSETAPQLQRNFSSSFGFSNATHNPSKAALVYNKNHGRESYTSFASYKSITARNSVLQSDPLCSKLPGLSALKFVDGKHPQVAPNAAVRRNSFLLTRDGKLDVRSSKDQDSNLKWSANDFPPLQPQQDNEHEKSDATFSGQAYVSGCDSLTPPRGRRSTLTDSSHTSTSIVPTDPTHVNCPLSKPKLVHRRSLSHPTPRAPYAECIPQTPELAMSPLTPKTSSVSSGFPQTPHTSTIPLPDCYDGEEEKKGARSDYTEGDKNVDRQTIFVGGLETFGPNAWDENKLMNLFRQYGPVESVKIIRPISKKSAFAFVRFADEDSPVRAIQREHNRVYNGRTIRVQLRDNQPFRGSWKSRGRSQVRVQHEACDLAHEVPLNKSSSSDGEGSADVVYVGLERFKRPDSSVRLDRLNIASSENWNASAVDTETVNLNSDLPVASTLTKVDGNQGAQTVPVRSTPHLTIPLEPSSTSAGGAIATQTLAPVAYYNGQGWIVPYGPGIAHTIPVPPYSAVLAPQNLPANQMNGAVGNSPDRWVDIHRSTFPYSSYSYFPASAQDIMANTNSDNRKKPPLSPTGFIQGEMGALIPVYPPDALNHYLNSNTSGQLSTQLQEQTATSFIESHRLLHPNTQWQNFRHPSQFYTYPIPSSTISSAFSPIIQHPFVQPQLNGQALATGQTSWVTPVQMASFANTTQQQHQSLATSTIPPSPHVQIQNQYAYPPVIPYFPVRNATLHEQRPRQYFNRQSPRRDSIHLTYNRNNNFRRSVRSSPNGPSNVSTVGSDTQGISRSSTVSSSGHPKENIYSPRQSSLFK